MTTSIPTTEPSTINPGDSVNWTRSLPDYLPSDGWVLSYELVKASTRYALSSSASGDKHLVGISAATSADYVAGDYDWRARVTKGPETYTVSTGRIRVKPSFATAIDARSNQRIALEAIEATLSGRATSATAEYEIAGRRLKYIPLPELLTLRDRYRIDVAREDATLRAAAGLPNPGRIYVRHI